MVVTGGGSIKVLVVAATVMMLVLRPSVINEDQCQDFRCFCGTCVRWLCDEGAAKVEEIGLECDCGDRLGDEDDGDNCRHGDVSQYNCSRGCSMGRVVDRTACWVLLVRPQRFELLRR